MYLSTFTILLISTMSLRSRQKVEENSFRELLLLFRLRFRFTLCESIAIGARPALLLDALNNRLEGLRIRLVSAASFR